MADERRPTVALQTVGCKLNQYETEGIAERFGERGFDVVPFDGTADVYVVNTCTVTGRSDYRSRQMLRRASRSGPNALIVATGCYAQRDPSALAAMPEVHAVVGNREKPRLADRVAELMDRPDGGRSGAATVVAPPLDGCPFEPYDITRFRGHTRAFIKIQDGCDRRCAYCAVPDARGPSRSRDFGCVVEQAALLVAGGYREVVLTGVHIGEYVSADGARLPELLRAVAGIPGLGRVRLGSLESRHLTTRVADLVAGNDGVANHLHVPLQSGSDRILATMGRDTTAAEYQEAVRRVTDRDPSCGLGADVMVGFPGETDDDFRRTVDLIESLPFTYLHVFAYSPRPGTQADALGEPVPPGEKRRRSRTLRALGRRQSLEFRRRLLGSRLEMLVERSEAGGVVSGLTANYVRVRADGPTDLKNRFVTVEIDRVETESTHGRLLEGTAR